MGEGEGMGGVALKTGWPMRSCADGWRAGAEFRRFGGSARQCAAEGFRPHHQITKRLSGRTRIGHPLSYPASDILCPTPSPNLWCNATHGRNALLFLVETRSRSGCLRWRGGWLVRRSAGWPVWRVGCWRMGGVAVGVGGSTSALVLDLRYTNHTFGHPPKDCLTQTHLPA